MRIRKSHRRLPISSPPCQSRAKVLRHEGMSGPLIFCAIDTNDLGRAATLSREVGAVTRGIKLGLEFVSAFGPAGIEKVREACPSAALFVDLKFHDIPNT